jgi:uncharacterized repeat protein (TIGR03843 family)
VASRSTRSVTSAHAGTASTSTRRPATSTDETLRVLTDGQIEVIGRLIVSTNHALLCRVSLACPPPEPPIVLDAVYKPIRGERPLDDFPDGTLAHREVAAFVVSEVTGWGIVPPTVLRDGPFGPGMIQHWVEVDRAVDVVALIVEADPRLRRIAVFDAIVNNTDRKGGHLLPVPGGHIHGVDHGVCFSPVPKLRTVLWGWRGDRLDETELDAVQRVRDELDRDLGADLGRLLAPVEVAATIRRAERLLRTARFPRPSPTWPAVPWPPF